MKGGPFALSLHWPDLALVVSGVSLKSGPTDQCESEGKKGRCKIWAFFFKTKMRRLKTCLCKSWVLLLRKAPTEKYLKFKIHTAVALESLFHTLRLPPYMFLVGAF